MADDALQLNEWQESLLAGAQGEAMQFAMHLVVKAAQLMGASRLIPAHYLHIDACHYYGTAHLDFAKKMLADGARFQIPALTNTVPVSLIQEEFRDGTAPPNMLREAKELAEIYLEMGAQPVWTCAPYHLPDAPKMGDHIIVGESNAVTYFNSVVGACTNKYGDFLDVACGLVQCVPEAGMHCEDNRRAELVIDVSHLPMALRTTEIFCHILGCYLGRIAGDKIAAIIGLPETQTPDYHLKALAAAAAASGEVMLFHPIGLTTQAPNLQAVLQESIEIDYVYPSADALIAIRDSLSGGVSEHEHMADDAFAMVAVGTPHFSYEEFAQLVPMVKGRKIHRTIIFYISTSRYILAQIESQGWAEQLKQAGIILMVDSCTYFSPAVNGAKGKVMTNSAKWAYYAPGMLPIHVIFGSLHDCVESAIAGKIIRHQDIWADDFWGK